MPQKTRLDLFIKRNIALFLKKEEGFSDLEMERLSLLPRTFWQNQIRLGFIRMGGNGFVKPSLKIEADKKDLINFNWKKIKRIFYSNFFPQSLAYPMTVEIIKDSCDFVVVNKAHGVNVYNRYPILKGSPQGASLVNGVSSLFPEIRELGTERPGIVHRLDRETGGVLVFAKNKSFYKFLKRKFSKREVRKTYLALVTGEFPYKKFFIQGLIGKNQKNPLVQKIVGYQLKKGIINDTEKYWLDYLKNFSQMTDFGSSKIINPKPSLTLGEVLSQGNFAKIMGEMKNNKDFIDILSGWKRIFSQNYKNPVVKNQVFSFIKLHPISGRTHQIRVHLSEAGFPIVGDKIYGSCLSQIPQCHFLHAYEIAWADKGGFF